MMQIFLLFFLLIPTVSSGIEKADSVLVIKSDSTLYLLKHGDVVKKYHVAFGKHPRGHKQQQGDERTPEGSYILDYKNPRSKFYKAIHISYPNDEDKKRARDKGVHPGGDIMIHGQKNFGMAVVCYATV